MAARIPNEYYRVVQTERKTLIKTNTRRPNKNIPLHKFSQVCSIHNKHTKFQNGRLGLWSQVWDSLSPKHKNVAPLFGTAWSKQTKRLHSVNANWVGKKLKHPSHNRADSKNYGNDIRTWMWPRFLITKASEIIPASFLSHNRFVSWSIIMCGDVHVRSLC